MTRLLGTAAVAMTLAAAGTAAPRTDHLLVLDQRAGPFRYLDGFTVGLRVGQTLKDVQRLYPTARFDRRSGWLVLRSLRDQELSFVRLAVVIDSRGRVTSIEVPATYIY